MTDSKKINFFNLVKACKDCPFKKGNAYLHPEGLMMRIEQVRDQDLSFSCHKTVAYGERERLDEINEVIEDELSELPTTCSHQEVQAKKIELAKELGLEEAIAEYKQHQDKEMMCAGMMILAKKEEFAFNNRIIRFAAMRGILDMNQYKDEDEVYDSIDQALKAHQKGL